MSAPVSSLVCRKAMPGEGRALSDIHQRAVHETACRDYGKDILESWHSLDPQRHDAFCAMLEKKISNGSNAVFTALLNDTIVGFGEVAPQTSTLVALYVHPAYGGQGAGTALLTAMEEYAVSRGAKSLSMDGSLTAESFYRKQGYAVLERSVHKLRSGLEMGCVKMRKELGL